MSKTAEKEKPMIRHVRHVSLNQEKTILVQPSLSKTQPLCKSTDFISNTPPPDNNGDFTTAMMVGMATDNGLLGGLVGGDLLGGIVGEMLHDSIESEQDDPTQSYEEPTQDTQSYESDSTSSNDDYGSSSYDDYSSSNDNN
jgi:hypothetical protein